MPDQLSLYNDALRILGARQLVSLAENRPSRRRLDAVWGGEEAVRYCLERGFWRFATRTVKLDAETDITPEFGYRYAFRKPEDWLRTAAVSTDEYFANPLTRYADEKDFWFTDVTPLYIQYTSSSTDFGLNYAAWPESFSKFVGHYLAAEIALQQTQSDSKAAAVREEMEQALSEAKTIDAMNQPAKFMPVSGWQQSRRGSTRGRYDRGGQY